MHEYDWSKLHATKLTIVQRIVKMPALLVGFDIHLINLCQLSRSTQWTNINMCSS